MKALTICQPWASCIAVGPKRIENRPWTTSYRGPLLIHAGKSRKYLHTVSGKQWLDWGIPAVEDLPFGAIVAVCELANCGSVQRFSQWPFAEGPYCWLLKNVRPIEPIEWSGKQWLFHVPDSISQEFRFLEVAK